MTISGAGTPSFPSSPRPRYAGVGRRAQNAATDTANITTAPRLASLDVERNRLGAVANLDRQGYEIQKVGYDSAYNAAQRQPGYINSLYNNTLANNDQQRLQQQIQNQANQRQYGMITADRGDIAANRKDNAADWAAYQETNADKGVQITQNEKLARVVAAEQVAGRGMMGATARAGVIQGRDQKGRDLAQNVRDLAAGNRQYDSRNRQFDAQGRDLDERWASTKDNEGIGNSRMAQLGLERDRYGIQNREDLAGANDNITKADVARKYAANQQATQSLNNMYDIWANGAQRNQVTAQAQQDAIGMLPYYKQQERDKVTAAQRQWDRDNSGYIANRDKARAELDKAKAAQRAHDKGGWSRFSNGWWDAEKDFFGKVGRGAIDVGKWIGMHA